MSRFKLCERCNIASNINSNCPTQVGNLWADADLRDVIQRYKKGETYEEIADLHGRRVDAIQRKLEYFRLIERAPNVRPVRWVPFGTITRVYPRYVQNDPTAVKRERGVVKEQEEDEKCTKKKIKKVKKGE